MKRYLYSILLAIFICISFSPASGQTCSEQPASVEHYSIPSETLYGELLFDVYVPPCIDDRIIGGYPVVYLLHGQDMGIEIWQEMDLPEIMRETLSREDIPLFLTVVPQEDQYLLSTALSGFEDALLYDLIPWIDEHFNTCTDRHCRSLAGLSRGALWTEKIAFEHPEYFGSIGMLSMPGTFIDDQSLYYLSEKHKPDNLLRIRMDTGNEDKYRHEGKNAAAQLTFIGYPYEYNIQPGDHDTDYWKSLLGDYFVWFSKDWGPVQSSSTITQTAE